MAEKNLSIILADDHPIVMTGYEIALSGFGIKTLAKVSDASLILEQYKALKPDVVVLDVRYGDHETTGLQIAAQLREFDPDVKMVVLSQSNQVETVQACFRLGVFGFLTKDCSAEDLEKGIRKAYLGEQYCNEGVSQKILANIQNPMPDPYSALNEKELAVMKMIADGDTLEQIGSKFEHSKRWAHAVVAGIKQKLGVERNADLTKLAVKFGITNIDHSER